MIGKVSTAGWVKRVRHVLRLACCGLKEATSSPRGPEVFRDRVGCGVNLNIGFASYGQLVPPA